MAASYAKLFEPVAGAKAGKALHLMKPEMFINALQSDKPILTIDVRTPNEASVVGMTLPGLGKRTKTQADDNRFTR